MCYTLPTDQLFNLEFQFESMFNLEFQAEFVVQLGIPILMSINLGECRSLTDLNINIIRIPSMMDWEQAYGHNPFTTKGV